MSFVQDAEAKIQLDAYQNTVRFYSDVDSFTQLSELTEDQARAIMKDLHSNNIKALQLIGPLAITMAVGNTIQLRALIIRSTDTINIPTLGALTDDATTIATWIKNPVNNVVTVSNGLVTAANIGSVGIYAKLGSFMTVTAAITVA
jgi:hypothetical protein